MERMIAYCGLICTDCGAYIATRAKDQAAIERVAAEWRVAPNNPNYHRRRRALRRLLVEGIKCFHCREVRYPRLRQTARRNQLRPLRRVPL
jgi:hypothetical protein